MQADRTRSSIWPKLILIFMFFSMSLSFGTYAWSALTHTDKAQVEAGSR